MDKKQLVAHFDGNQSKLARFLSIRPQAVSKWGDRVPREHQLDLRLRRPDLFDESGELKPAPALAVEQAA